MIHFGLICPPGVSHITGLTGIARELCRRGHRATLFHILDFENVARQEGVEFFPLGTHVFPKGALEHFAQQLSHAHGLKLLLLGRESELRSISMYLDEAPDALSKSGVTALLVDQFEAPGSTIAERLGLPFVTICNAVSLNPDPALPPPIVSWNPASSRAEQHRMRIAWSLLELVLTPMRHRINRYRKSWGLKSLNGLHDTASPILQLAQQTEEFDFPRQSRPSQFRYIGLIRREGSSHLPFPFDRLDGRPLVYGSLGTLRSDTDGMFHVLAQACSDLDLQLVITLGGKDDLSKYSELPGAPIVVKNAPQLKVLERAAITFCHGGNNTVLESLAAGVPVIAVPLNGDQYGVAARLQYSGAGERIMLKELNALHLRDVLRKILSQPSYTERARAMQASLQRAGGERRAADLIEEKLSSCTTLV
jgi:zeaxanthin glucosyltransferase